MRDALREFYDWFNSGDEDIFEAIIKGALATLIIFSLPLWIIPYIIYRIWKKRAN